MNTTTAVKRANFLATGKASDLVAGTAKYLKVLEALNIAKSDWFNEPNTYWRSTREYVEVGTVSATDAYDLDEEITKISTESNDNVLIENGANTYRYAIVPAGQLYSPQDVEGDVDGVCAKVGSQLVFAEAFTASSAEFGGTIRLPHYVEPDDLADPNDDYLIDNPQFGCYMAASILVSNDVTKSYREPSLVASANNLMDGMKADNMAQLESAYSSWNPLGHIGVD